jgi:hypothetical protein
MVSRNQDVEFECKNLGYELIEWKIIGYSYIIKSGSLSGMSSKIKISWGEIGMSGVKVRLRDTITHIFSQWSNIYSVSVM